MADGHSRTPGDALSGSLSDGRWAAGLARAGSLSDRIVPCRRDPAARLAPACMTAKQVRRVQGGGRVSFSGRQARLPKGLRGYGSGCPP